MKREVLIRSIENDIDSTMISYIKQRILQLCAPRLLTYSLASPASPLLGISRMASYVSKSNSVTTGDSLAGHLKDMLTFCPIVDFYSPTPCHFNGWRAMQLKECPAHSLSKLYTNFLISQTNSRIFSSIRIERQAERFD
jgi:hypothetical protein